MKIFFTSLLLVLFGSISAQVGINTTDPSDAAVLEVSSSNGSGFGGFLPPRVSQTERDAIPVNASDDGMMVFLIEGTTRCLQIYDGVEGEWENAYCMPVNAAPVASAVSVTGCEILGEILTASYTYTDAEGDAEGATTFRWFRAVDASGTGATVIAGATTNTYTLTALDVGFYIAVEVTPVALTGTITGAPTISSYVGPVAGTGTCGPVLLGIQDFEVTPATPTLPYVENNPGTLQTGNGTNPNTPTYIDARSYGVNNDNADLDFGPVDASGYTDATLNFRMASYSVGGSSGNGADLGDYIDVYISTDGGFTFSYELEITGNSNARYDFSATGTQTIVYDGDNTATSVATPTGSAGYSYISITGLPNSANLVVGIVMVNNNANELWVIDNVEVYGN